MADNLGINLNPPLDPRDIHVDTGNLTPGDQTSTSGFTPPDATSVSVPGSATGNVPPVVQSNNSSGGSWVWLIALVVGIGIAVATSGKKKR